MTNSKTPLVSSSSTHRFNGKSCHAKHNHMFINEYRRDQQENDRPEDKGER